MAGGDAAFGQRTLWRSRAHLKRNVGDPAGLNPNARGLASTQWIALGSSRSRVCRGRIADPSLAAPIGSKRATETY